MLEIKKIKINSLQYNSLQIAPDEYLLFTSKDPYIYRIRFNRMVGFTHLAVLSPKEKVNHGSILTFEESVKKLEKMRFAGKIQTHMSEDKKEKKKNK